MGGVLPYENSLPVRLWQHNQIAPETAQRSRLNRILERIASLIKGPSTGASSIFPALPINHQTLSLLEAWRGPHPAFVITIGRTKASASAAKKQPG